VDSPSARKRVTLAEVAAEAGVSVMTASYAYGQPARVSALRRARVLDAAARLGYAGPDPAARSLRRGQADCLGIVLGEHLSYAFEDAQAAAFLAGVADVCAARGCAMTILPVTGTADDSTRIRVAAVDALVIWTLADDDPVLAAVQAQGCPAVVHSGPAIAGAGLVTIDNRAAARAIGAVTFARACRPAVLSFPADRDRASSITAGLPPAAASFPVTRQRLQGFRDAANCLGLDWTSVPVAVCSRNDRAQAESLTDQLLRGPGRPDTIAAMSDEQAAGALRAIRAAGLRVPDDIAVSGWDDSPAAAHLGLTTIRQSLRDQGSACATAALDGPLGHEAAPWTLVHRSSTRTLEIVG
jgi:DNA-binding LacI/PurR family transcriptional regulator